MRPNLRLRNRANGSLEDSPEIGRGGGARAISVRHQLLGDSWTADVEALEGRIGRFRTDGNPPNNCKVVFFEIAGDGHLHVNVTHKYETKSVTGWAGPGNMPDGFIHNRRFRRAPENEMIRHIRDMVFAARV